ncbi:hypothetical protein ACSYR0_03300 (plasmid) [Bacillus cereus]|uniref:hypothetical protein n=1 Tax=Bacillus cereus TaxID=1396 RepID=UPI0001A0CE78|nr:hypothetical protein [Bacillus cereus]EEL61842.1 hypothetical protein bcere0025_54400 [Bacillus cereus F65185]PFI70052.1 hypothetical protein COI85_26745 [Bacillus cereus]PFJ63121.1 hypothetical protein COI94_24895 [Bacillus cereus]PFN42473.1 hypothetical protein COJ57_01555 [Bacillus cereus]
MIDDSFVKESTCIKDIPEEVIMLATFQEELRLFLEEEDETKTLKDFFEEEDITTSQQEFFFENINKCYKYFEEALEGVALDKYLPEEFNAEKLTELENTDESILFIIDKKLSDRNYKIALKEVLEKVTNIIKKKNNCFLFIYTSEVENIENYEDLNYFLNNEIGLSPDIVEVISLHINFVEKQNNLSDSVVDTAIRKSQKAKYLYSFYTIQKNTMDSMNRRIWEINNNELLIHYNYLSEGQHIDEILFDIYQSKFLRVYEEFYRENSSQKLQPLRNAIHSYVSNIPNIKNYTIYSRIIKELNKEFLRDNSLKYIHLSNDISYGDVIQIKDRFYLVCSQQCDITIRADGKRANENIALLEIKRVIKQMNASAICEIIDNILKYTVRSRDINAVVENLLEIDEFKDLINNQDILREISNYYAKDDYTFKNDNVRSSYEYFEYKKKTDYYNISSFILDSILLGGLDGIIKVTDDTINACSDLRYSTKGTISKGFAKLKRQTEEWLSKPVNEAVLPDVILPDLDKEFIIKEKKLEGIELSNISRIGRLNEERTHEIHQEHIKHTTRVAKNEAPIF